MIISDFAGILGFSVAAAFTPGPNNLIALASGANFGYRKTLPHVLGVCVGFTVMLALMGLGLGSLFRAVPLAYTILKYASFAYLMFLAWKIATSKGIGEGAAASRPFSVLSTATFQWVNPKAWIAAITIVSSFTAPERFWVSLSINGAINIVLAFLAVSSWALFGTAVKNWLTRPLWYRVFNWTMAILLVATVAPSVFRH